VNLVRTGAGGLAGAAATIPMTGWMLVGQAVSDHHPEQPPKTLVRRTARRFGVPAQQRGPFTTAAAALTHLGIGAGGGALYASLVPRSTTVRGVLFGVALWGVAYTGMIPRLRLLPPPGRDAPGRAWTTATAHVIYGAALGAGLAALNRRLATGPGSTPA
jgi:hypothetical protein